MADESEIEVSNKLLGEAANELVSKLQSDVGDLESKFQRSIEKIDKGGFSSSVMTHRQAQLRRSNYQGPHHRYEGVFGRRRNVCLGETRRWFAEITENPKVGGWKTCGPPDHETAKRQGKPKMSQAAFGLIIRSAEAKALLEIEEHKNSEFRLMRLVLQDLFRWEDREGYRLCFGFGRDYVGCVGDAADPELRLRVIRGTTQELQVQNFLEFDEIGPHIIVQLGDNQDPDRRYRISVIYADRAVSFQSGRKKERKFKGLPRWPTPLQDVDSVPKFIGFLFRSFVADRIFSYRNKRNLSVSRDDKFTIFEEVKAVKALPAPKSEPAKLPGAVVSG